MEDEYSDSPMSPCMWRRRPARSMRKNKFTEADDEKLKGLVEIHGLQSWELISKKMGNKNVRQCKERWENYLSPTINKEPWSEEEDRKLIEKQKEIGSKWVKIATFFPGRTDASVKNRWQMLDRKEKKKNNLFIRRKKKAVEKAQVEEQLPTNFAPSPIDTDDSFDYYDYSDVRVLDFPEIESEFQSELFSAFF